MVNNNIQQLKNKIDTLTKTVSKLRTSDQLITNAVNYAPIGMVTLAINGKFKTVNRAFCQLVGYTKKELLTFNISEITHPDDKYIGNNVIGDLASGKAKKANFEKRYIHKNGTIIQAQVSTVILKDDLGTPVNFFTQVIDVTESKKAEKIKERLQKTLQQERDMFITGPVVVFNWKNSEGWPVEYVSHNVKEVFGYTDHDLTTGKVTYAKLIPQKDIERVANEVSVNMNSGAETFTHKPYRIMRKDGIIIWIDDYTRIIRNEDGVVTNFMGYIIEITERKQAEEKLISRNKELEIWAEVTTDRELKMIELKKEINELLEKSDKKPKYAIPA